MAPATGVQSPATWADVVACYRLLLGRPPDPEGAAHYRQQLAAGATVGQVVEEFLGSVELARAHPGLMGESRRTQLVATAEGFSMYVDPTDYAVGHTVARTRTYEPEVSSVLRQVLSPGGTLVDVGANMGWFSLLGASVVGPAGRVVAVEPNPANVALLASSVEENGFTNVQVFTVAASDRTGAVALETDGSNGRVIVIDGPPHQPVRASWVVAAQPLDELVGPAGVGRVDVVKLDVEGAEPLVLRGAASVLERCRPVVITEFYPEALDASPWGSAAGYLEMLRGLGYRLSVIGSDEGPPGTEASDELVLAQASQPGRPQLNLLALPSG